MAAGDDVVFKVAGDVSNIVAALDKLLGQFDEMFTRMDTFAARVEPAFNKAEKAVDGLFGTVAAGTTIGTFFGNQLTKAFDAVVDVVGDVTTALPNLIDNTATVADHFLTLSQQTGISVDALSELDFVASQTGTSLEGLTSSIFLMQRNIANGGEGVSTALRKIKVDVNDLKALKPEDAFVLLMEELGKLPTQAEKASAGMALFGRNFRSISQLTTEDIKKLRAEADELGGSFDQAAGKMGDAFKDAQDRLGRVFQGFTRQLGVALLPAATQFVDGMTEIFKDFFAEVGVDFEGFGNTAEDAVDQLLVIFRSFADDMVPVARLMVDAFETGLKALPPLIDAIGKSVKTLSPFVTILLDIIGRLGELPPVVLAAGAALLIYADNVGVATVATKAFEAAVYLLGPGLTLFQTTFSVVAAGLKAQFAGAIIGATMNLTLLKTSILATLPSLAALEAALGTLWLVISTISVVLLAVAAAWAVWEIGKWIAEVTGLGEAIDYLILRLQGLSQAEAEAELASRKAAEAAKEQREELAQAEADARKKMEDLAGAATLLASQGKLTEFQLKRIGREAAGLKDQGIALDPVLQSIVDALDRMSKSAQEAGDAVEQLTDAEKLLKFQQLQNERLDVRLNEQQKAALASGLARRRNLGDIIKDMKEAGLATDEHTVAINKYAESYGKSNKASEAFRNQTEELAIQIRNAQAAGVQWHDIVRLLGPAALSAANAAATLKGGFERLSETQKKLIADAQKLKLDELFQGVDVEAYKRNQDALARVVADSMEVLQKNHLQTFENLQDEAKDGLLKLSQERMTWAERELSIIEDTRQKEIKALGPTPAIYRGMYDKITDAKLAALAREVDITEAARARELKQLSDQLKSIGLTGVAYDREYTRLAAFVNEKYDAMNAASQARVQKEIKDIGALPDIYEDVYEQAADNVEQQAQRMREAVQGATPDPEDLAKKLGIFTKRSIDEQLKQAEAQLAEMKKSTQFLPEDIFKQEQKIFDLRDKLRGLEGERSKARIDAEIQAERDKIARFKEINDDYNREHIRKSEERIRQLEKERDGTRDILGGIADAFVRMGQASQGNLSDVLGGVGQMLQLLKQSKDTTDKTGQNFGFLSQAFDKTATGADRMAAGVAAAATVMSGINSVMDATQASATRAGNALNGALAGAQAGAAFGPWGIAIGAAAGLVAGLIRGKPAWAKAADEVGRDFGVKISDELAKAIADSSKELFGGDRFTAEVFHLADIIKEAGGVNQENFAQLMARYRDTFVLLETGALDAAQATQVLDENFDALLVAGTDAYGNISDSLKEVIALNERFGTESQAIANFLRGQGETLLDAFSDVEAASASFDDLQQKLDDATEARDELLNGTTGINLEKKVKDAQKEVDRLVARGKKGTQEWREAQADLNDAIADQRDHLDAVAQAQKDYDAAVKAFPLGTLAKDSQAYAEALAAAKAELDDLGTQAVTAFAVAVKAGVPWDEALKQISPSLQRLKKDYESLGLSIEDAGLKTLVIQSSIADANPKLIKGISALSAQMVALDNLGGQTPENFAAMQRTAERLFDQLQVEATNAGGGMVDALLPMQQFLHDAIKAAKDLGVPLDAATQKMIDASKEAGIWKDEQMSINDIMITGFAAIIEALGGTIPEAWRKMLDAAKTSSTEAAEAAAKAAEDTARAAEEAAAAAADAATKAAEEAAAATTEATDGAAESAEEQWERVFADLKAKQNESEGDWLAWAEAADRGCWRTRNALQGKVITAIDGVGNELDNIDWQGWAADAVDAADAVKDAVDAAALGASPGGVREIRTQVNLARDAFMRFRVDAVDQMRAVKSASEAVALRSPDLRASADRLAMNSVRLPVDRQALGGPSVYIASGAFPISTWSVGSETEMIKKKLTPAVLTAVHGGGDNYERFESMVRKVRK